MSDDPMEARLMAAIAQVGIDLMARLDRLQASVDAVRDDIAVAMGANDTSPGRNRPATPLARNGK